jgi:hypothetical protein
MPFAALPPCENFKKASKKISLLSKTFPSGAIQKQIQEWAGDVNASRRDVTNPIEKAMLRRQAAMKAKLRPRPQTVSDMGNSGLLSDLGFTVESEDHSVLGAILSGSKQNHDLNFSRTGGLMAVIEHSRRGSMVSTAGEGLLSATQPLPQRRPSTVQELAKKQTRSGLPPLS